MMTKIAAFTLLTLALLLTSACGISDTPDCDNLVHDWNVLIKRMEQSNRFNKDFIIKHKTGYISAYVISEIANKFPAKERNAECLKQYRIIQPQMQLSKELDSLPQDKLEEYFPRPPLPPLSMMEKSE